MTASDTSVVSAIGGGLAGSGAGGAGGGAAGSLGAAAATNAYGGPVYVTPAYRECRLVERYDRWGNLRVVQVCSY